MNNQKFEIQSSVKDGKLSRNRKTISDVLSAFEGKNVTITIQRSRSKRSNQQNRFWHGVVVPIVQERLRELGNLFSKESTHELLKLQIAKMDPQLMIEETILETTGEVLKRIKSTSELSTSQFMDLIAHTQQWAAETLDIEIPDPNEQLTLKAA